MKDKLKKEVKTEKLPDRFMHSSSYNASNVFYKRNKQNLHNYLSNEAVIKGNHSRKAALVRFQHIIAN